MRRPARVPADDPASTGIDDEGDVDEPRPGRDVGSGGRSVVVIGIILAALIVQGGRPPATNIPSGGGDDIVVLRNRLKKVLWEFQAKNGA